MTTLNSSNQTAIPSRTLTADLFISLDGFAKGVDSGPYFGFAGPDLDRWIKTNLDEQQEVVFGRVTYELLAPITMQSTDETSTKLNDLPKIVVSSTLQEPFTWSNIRALRGDLSQSIKSLKAQAGPPLRSMGSVSLVKSLLSLGLIDCLRLVVFPLTLRDKGREHIFDGFPVGTYNLAGESVLDSRLVVLEYHPDLPKDTNAKR